MSGNSAILIVEDDEISIFVITKMLKGQFEVLTASSSQEALSTLKANPGIDLVLMDINLGEENMDGTRLMQEIRVSDEHTSPAFVAVTSYAMTGDREYFLTKGFTDYVPKPIDQQQLLTTIRAHIT